MMLEEYGLVPASEMAPALAGAARGVPVTEQEAADAAAAWREEHMPFTMN